MRSSFERDIREHGSPKDDSGLGFERLKAQSQSF